MRPTAHVELRPATGRQATEKTLDQPGKIEVIGTDVRTLQYLHARGEKTGVNGQ